MPELRDRHCRGLEDSSGDAYQWRSELMDELDSKDTCWVGRGRLVPMRLGS